MTGALLALTLLVAPLGPAQAPELPESVELGAQGGVTFKAPSWKKAKHDEAVAVFEVAPSKEHNFGVLIVSAEAGPRRLEQGVDWDRIRQNIVGSAGETGTEVDLADGGAFTGPAAFKARLFHGTMKAGERTVGLHVIALLSEGTMIAITTAAPKDDERAAALAKAVAGTVATKPPPAPPPKHGTTTSIKELRIKPKYPNEQLDSLTARRKFSDVRPKELLRRIKLKIKALINSPAKQKALDYLNSNEDKYIANILTPIAIPWHDTRYDEHSYRSIIQRAFYNTYRDPDIKELCRLKRGYTLLRYKKNHAKRKAKRKAKAKEQAEAQQQPGFFKRKREEKNKELEQGMRENKRRKINP